MKRLFINIYCALVANKTKRRKIRRVLLNQDRTEFLEKQNVALNVQIQDLRNQLHIAKKKKVLIVSSSFYGGGLEKRINNIVDHLHNDYSFSLITKTAPENMNTKPSKYIEHIYSWDEYSDALFKVDILDVHPFDCGDVIKKWHVSSQIKKIYTLHGVASLGEKLDFLQDYDRI